MAPGSLETGKMRASAAHQDLPRLSVVRETDSAGQFLAAARAEQDESFRLLADYKSIYDMLRPSPLSHTASQPCKPFREARPAAIHCLRRLEPQLQRWSINGSKQICQASTKGSSLVSSVPSQKAS